MYNICSTKIPESIKASAGQSSIADFHSSPSISFPVPVMRPELRKETAILREFFGWLKETFTCLLQVIESVDPATKILFPGRTVDGHVLQYPQTHFKHGCAAMLMDLTKRWI